MAHYKVLSAEGDVSFIADADMTTKQYKFVTVASAVGYVKMSTGASNPVPIGVLQNSPSQNQEARVRLFGYTKLQGRANSTCLVAWGRGIRSGSDANGEDTGGDITVANALWLDSAISDAGSVIGAAFLFPAGRGPSACGLAAS